MKLNTVQRINWDISAIGFGAWALGESSWGTQDDGESIRTLNKAVDSGVNFFDTAAVYGDGHSERILGDFLRSRSETLRVATKTQPEGGEWPPSPYGQWQDAFSERYLRANVEARLRNLKVERLDLLQLHTWTRAWNKNPEPFHILRKMQQEGKIAAIGVSTPEQDQNSVIDLMRQGLVDFVQVIFNLFDQEPAAELLPVAQETGTGIIVRVVFDEGALTGKFAEDTKFGKGDFRGEYFRGERLKRVVSHVEKIREDLADTHYTLPQAAILYALSHPAVTTVIPGMRTVAQAEANCAVGSMNPMSPDLLQKLQRHNWRRGVWYPGNW